jgi:type I restriction enzyme S subunit
MKKGWQTKKLGELCEIELGRTPARANAAFWDEKRETSNVWLSIADLLKTEDNVVVDSKEYVSDKGAEICKLVPKGTLLVSFKLTLGRLAFAGRDLFTNEAIAALTIFNERELSKEFLFYFLHFFDWVKTAENDVKLKGMTLNKAKLKEMDVHFPRTLSDQQRNVGILDEAFDGIATAKSNAEKNLQNSNALFQSVLCHAVIGETTNGWRKDRRSGKTSAHSDLKELLHQIAGTDRKPVRIEETTGHEALTRALPEEWRHTSIEMLFNLIDYRGKTASKSATGRRLITARNIKMGYLSEEPVTFISEDQYKKWMVRGFPKPGDILFVTEGHTMGFVALNTRDDDFALAQRTITLQPAVPFSTKFFFYFMLSPHFQKLVKLNATGAAAVGMKASKFRSLPLAFPPVAEQEIIADKLDDLREETQHLASLYERKLAALEALKKSLLHQAFTGQL